MLRLIFGLADVYIIVAPSIYDLKVFTCHCEVTNMFKDKF